MAFLSCFRYLLVLFPSCLLLLLFVVCSPARPLNRINKESSEILYSNRLSLDSSSANDPTRAALPQSNYLHKLQKGPWHSGTYLNLKQTLINRGKDGDGVDILFPWTSGQTRPVNTVAQPNGATRTRTNAGDQETQDKKFRPLVNNKDITLKLR